MDKENSQIVLLFVISAAFLVVVAVLLVLFVVIYQKKVVNQDIKLQKLLNEQQKNLLRATIEGQERERERLSKELHDGIGSLLAGLSLHLKYHRGNHKVNPAIETFLSEASKLVDEGSESIRSISHNLLPASLEKFGLVTAMKECVGPINATSVIKVNIHSEISKYAVGKEVELGLLRIFQEFLQNTLKHAQADVVNASLHLKNKVLSLDYEDNGIGFNINEHRYEGIGLKNIRSRVQALDGKLELRSSQNGGFHASVEIPIQQTIIQP